jgi:hypothetical protein
MSALQDPIPTSLTRMSSDLASRAVKMFLLVLKYIGQGGTDLTEAERTQLVLKLYKHTLRRLELRDELFAQLLKQLRNNPHRCALLFSGCFVVGFKACFTLWRMQWTS